MQFGRERALINRPCVLMPRHGAGMRKASWGMRAEPSAKAGSSSEPGWEAVWRQALGRPGWGLYAEPLYE